MGGPRSLQALVPAVASLHLIGAELGPLHLALGGALTGIAAAIAGAIAAKVFADRRPRVAPGGTAAGGRPSQEAGGDIGDRAPRAFDPPPPPARIRLALPPEEPASPEGATEPETPSEADDATAG